MGPYFLSRYLLPVLIQTKGDTQAVINIVSVALQLNFSSMMPVAYSLSKSTVQRLTEHWILPTQGRGMLRMRYARGI